MYITVFSESVAPIDLLKIHHGLKTFCLIPLSCIIGSNFNFKANCNKKLKSKEQKAVQVTSSLKIDILHGTNYKCADASRKQEVMRQ